MTRFRRIVGAGALAVVFGVGTLGAGVSAAAPSPTGSENAAIVFRAAGDRTLETNRAFESGAGVVSASGPTEYMAVQQRGTGFYRGGSSMAPRAIDYVVKNGLVQPTQGVSLRDVPTGLDSFGGPYAVISYPDTLEIAKKGNDPHHYVMRPKAPMPEDEYIGALGKVVLEKV